MCRLNDSELKEQGFTLIELLVVILVIGILSAIAVPMFLNQRKSAMEASLKSDLKQAGLSMETASVKAMGKYPDVLPADFKGSDGNKFSIMDEAGNKNISAGSAENSTTSYPGRISWHVAPGDKAPKITKVDGFTRGFYQDVTSNPYAGPYWDFIPKDPAGIPMGTTFSGSVMVRSSVNVCLPLQFEQHKTTPGVQKITGPDTCLVADEWKEITVTGSTNYVATSVTLIAYSRHENNSIFDYKDPIIVFGDTINRDNINVAVNQKYCIQGYNEGDSDNIWHYSTLNGGVHKGKC